MNAPVVCSIGTSEPWNAAGLGLDIRALAECGAYAVTVTAGVTAQDRTGVHAALAVPAALVEAELAALAEASIAAYRVGVLLDVATVEVIAAHLATVDVPVVYDPALAPSGGGRFGSDEVTRAIRRSLLPVVTLVTPNLVEAATLTERPVGERGSMEAAASVLVSLGAQAALVKGGHLPERTIDVLVDVEGTFAYEAERLPGTLRGTGCLLACSLAAALAQGLSLRDAVARARAFVRAKIAHPHERGGMSLAY
jgi:hydroxymethylpyrimidine kinase/phosphomethylpyrimidine kinase